MAVCLTCVRSCAVCLFNGCFQEYLDDDQLHYSVLFICSLAMKNITKKCNARSNAEGCTFPSSTVSRRTCRRCCNWAIIGIVSQASPDSNSCP